MKDIILEIRSIGPQFLCQKWPRSLAVNQLQTLLFAWTTRDGIPFPKMLAPINSSRFFRTQCLRRKVSSLFIQNSRFSRVDWKYIVYDGGANFFLAIKNCAEQFLFVWWQFFCANKKRWRLCCWKTWWQSAAAVIQLIVKTIVRLEYLLCTISTCCLQKNAKCLLIINDTIPPWARRLI